MTKRVLLVALLALVGAGAAAPGAAAKGLEMAARNGVTVSGSPYRYVAISPHITPKLTVVARIDRRDGRVDRWWQLPGDYHVPAVAYDNTGGGLSADEKTLVLSRSIAGNPPVYPPRTTRLAILDTVLNLQRHPKAGQRQPRHATTNIDLRGHYTFDAISPDGSTIYLIRYHPRFTGPDYIVNYEVRALDVESGRLLPEPIVDPEEPEERMEGLPLTRAASPDGRWAYTLYDGNGGEPFIHALDTVAGSAVCIDLPQLKSMPRRFHYLLRLQARQGGRELVLRRLVPGPPKPRTLLTVNARTFDVRGPSPVATASSGIGPWPPIAVLCAAVLALLAWIGLRQRHAGGALQG